MLGAVDDPFVAVTPRSGGHTAHVGPGAGLGDRQALLLLAADCRQQVVVDLLACAPHEDAARTCHEVVQGEGGAAQLALDQCQRDGVQAAAADLLWHVRRVEASVQRLGADLLLERRGDLVELLDLVLVRHQLAVDEGANRLDDRALLVAQCEVHGLLLLRWWAPMLSM